MFLSYMPAEDAYWVMTALMDDDKWGLRHLFVPGTPMVPQTWYIMGQLLNEIHPKLAKHFETEMILPSMYLTEWFVTLYTRSFPFSLVVRVWDIFLHEGWKIIYRIALALLKIGKKELLSLDMEGIMGFFRRFPGTVDPSQVLRVAHAIPLKTADVQYYTEKYKERQGDPKRRMTATEGSVI